MILIPRHWSKRNTWPNCPVRWVILPSCRIPMSDTGCPPIGGVMATRDTVIPNGVGVDIGCGVCAVRTSLRRLEADSLKRIMSRIRQTIPLGFKHHDRPQARAIMPALDDSLMKVVRDQFSRARRQPGTLGGGNHFIEIQKGDDGFIWIMIHSSSRNLGHKVASFHNKRAIHLNEQSSRPVPKSWQGFRWTVVKHGNIWPKWNSASSLPWPTAS